MKMPHNIDMFKVANLISMAIFSLVIAAYFPFSDMKFALIALATFLLAGTWLANLNSELVKVVGTMQ